MTRNIFEFTLCVDFVTFSFAEEFTRHYICMHSRTRRRKGWTLEYSSDVFYPNRHVATKELNIAIDNLFSIVGGHE